MIPLDITDEVVLRRTLEDIEARLPLQEVQVSPVDKLAYDADLATTVAKVNELVDGLNALSDALRL